jgi:hypothetical protein
MKAIKYTVLLFITCFLAIQIDAQSGTTAKPAAKSSTSKTGTKSSAKKSTPAPVKPITISVHNACERDVIIFAGGKVDLKNPKPRQKILGGLSTNTLYLKTSDLVCIMTDKGKNVSCADIKAGMTKVEINISGNVITGK